MKTYIGTKVVKAVPVMMVNGCIWPDGLPLPELGPEHVACDDACSCDNKIRREVIIDEGYCFRTDEKNGVYPEWQSKDDFEKIFRPAENLTFGDALEAIKQGYKAARKGWNGKNQYVELAACISYKSGDGEPVNAEHCNIGNKALAFVGTSGVQLGWLASQADMLAEDWYIVE